jgi:serine/threonine-protein kinase RIO1
MMVMAIVAVADKLESRRAIAEIKPLYHAHFLKQMHGAINRGQIAPVFWHGAENFPVRQRMRMSPENFQDRLAWTRDLARLPAQTTRQRG